MVVVEWSGVGGMGGMGWVNPSGLRQSGFFLDKTEEASVIGLAACVCVCESVGWK